MTQITDLATLHALYGAPAEVSLRKVTNHLTPTYQKWIERARFCLVSTVGPEGTDGSPRGDSEPVVKVFDTKTLLLPDWHGNNRIDTLRNIVRDSRISLLFLIPGSNNAMRVNGKAVLTINEKVLELFDRQGKRPRSVIVVTMDEVYSQCARALIRSELWSSGDQSQGLPTVGDMMRDVTSGAFDGTTYDAEWPSRAAKTMW